MTDLQHSPRRNQWLIIALVVAILGIAFSVYATMHHVEVKATGQTDAACNINESFSCDSVALSEYAEVFGIPLGIYGLGYFLGCAGLLFIGFLGGKTAREHLHAYSAMVGIGLVTALVLAAISYFSLGAYCPTCIGVYVLTLLQGILLFAYRSEIPGQFSANSLFAGGTSAAIALAAVIAVFTLWSPGQKAASEQAQESDSSLPSYSKKQYDIPLAKSAYAGLGEDFRKGNDNAPVVIHEFADFQCPACQRISAILGQVAKEYENDVLVVFRNYPLDNACNGSINRKMHEYACNAAVMARCAGQFGKFWPYHDLIFSRQEEMKSDQFLKDRAKDVGLTPDQINSCWGNKDILAKIKEDIALGNKFGVNSTPTVFINGRKYLGGKSVQAFRMEINQLLN